MMSAASTPRPGVPQLVGRRPIQIGIVVRDLEAAVARYTRLLGIEDWLTQTNSPQLNLRGLRFRGQPADFSERVAISDGKPQIELLQPLEGSSIHVEWLERHGEGLQHLAYRVDSVEATIAAMENAGYVCLQEGYGFLPDGSGGFAYFDLEAEFGHLVEVVEL
jgi:catechol 2,3-dioxygenase-like lactoylglutathione lyase family enzyme